MTTPKPRPWYTVSDFEKEEELDDWMNCFDCDDEEETGKQREQEPIKVTKVG